MKVIRFIYEVARKEKPFSVFLVVLTILALCAPTSKAYAKRFLENNSSSSSGSPVESSCVVYQSTTTAISTTTPVLETTQLATSSTDCTTTTTTTFTSVISTTITTTTTETETVTNADAYSYSDFILLCNCVAHEAGADNISIEEKAKVVEVVLNRVQSEDYPNTVYEVLTQKNQFSGASTYVDLGDFSPKVTNDVILAVESYLDGKYDNHGYLSFLGDGKMNHFS